MARNKDAVFPAVQEVATKFQARANAFGKGYCKPWKANSMVHQIADIAFDTPEGVTLGRVQDFVKGCLEMEGFRRGDCDVIAAWLFVELLTIADSKNHAERELRRIHADNPRNTQ